MIYILFSAQRRIKGSFPLFFLPLLFFSKEFERKFLEVLLPDGRRNPFFPFFTF